MSNIKNCGGCDKLGIPKGFGSSRKPY